MIMVKLGCHFDEPDISCRSGKVEAVHAFAFNGWIGFGGSYK
jgi:hypothetical protein